MKKFLTFCIIAMISAGIYGFIDMSRDIKNGTMIKYEDQSAPKVIAYSHARTQAQAINNSVQIKLAEYTEAKRKTEAENKKKLELTNMKFEDFSRGEGIYIPETEITNETTDAPSIIATDSVKTTPPQTSQVKKVATDSATITAVEEPSLNTRMFSRGSPSMYKKTLAKK